MASTAPTSEENREPHLIPSFPLHVPPAQVALPGCHRVITIKSELDVSQ